MDSVRGQVNPVCCILQLVRELSHHLTHSQGTWEGITKSIKLTGGLPSGTLEDAVDKIKNSTWENHGSAPNIVHTQEYPQVVRHRPEKSPSTSKKSFEPGSNQWPWDRTGFPLQSHALPTELSKGTLLLNREPVKLGLRTTQSQGLRIQYLRLD